MDVVIRVLLPTDVAAYRALRLYALEESPSAFGASLRQDALLTHHELTQRIAVSPERFVLGAFVQDELVGLVGFVREGGDKHHHIGFIWGMFVRPEFRAQGIGQRLLSAALQRADAMPGLRRVRLSVVTSNLSALRLYQRFGFVSYGEEPEALCVDGIYYAEHHLARIVEAKSGKKHSRVA